MIFQEIYQQVAENLVVVLLVTWLTVICYLLTFKFVRFCLSRYGTRTLSYLITMMLVLFWVFSDFSFLSSPASHSEGRYRLLTNGLIGLMMLGLSLLVFIAVKSL